MDRLLLAVGLVAVAIGVAALLRRRTADAPTQTSWAVPTQLDPSDLATGDDAPAAVPADVWTLVLFSSATCNSCAGVRHRLAELAVPGRVRVVDLEVGDHGDLHRKYEVDAVPMLLAVDALGLVRASMVGPLDDDDVARLHELCARPPTLDPDDGTPVDLRDAGSSGRSA